MNNFCSIVDEGYIQRAVVLHGSLESWCRPYHWYVLALDEKTATTLSKLDHVTVEGYGDWCPFSLDIPTATRKAEGLLDWNVFIWALKPVWLSYLLDNVGLSAVSYIDADCYFFGSPDELFDEIGDALLAVTPHRFSPEQERFSVNGKYNGGFIHAKRSSVALECMLEWTDVCAAHGNGKHTEQKYLDTWPGKWGAHVIKHVGVDLAPWNQAGQYTYTCKDGRVYVDGSPLIFYHFHQRLKPHYPINKFVLDFIYGVYEMMLDTWEVE